MGVITTLEIQKKNKQRVNVYLDGEYAFSLTLMEAAKLRKGQELSDAEIAALSDEDAVLKAVNSAIHFLSFRPRSVHEVRQNLQQKKTPPDVIDAALERVLAAGYLDDDAFTRYWVENRSTFKPSSPRALRYELRQKGISDTTINEVLSNVDADESAYSAAQTRVYRLRGTTREDFRDKIVGFLQRRGFSYTTAKDVIQRLIEEIDAQEPEYFSDADVD